MVWQHETTKYKNIRKKQKKTSLPPVGIFLANQIWVFLDHKYFMDEFLSGFNILDVLWQWKEQALFYCGTSMSRHVDTGQD